MCDRNLYGKNEILYGIIDSHLNVKISLHFLEILTFYLSNSIDHKRYYVKIYDIDIINNYKFLKIYDHIRLEGQVTLETLKTCNNKIKERLIVIANTIEKIKN